MKYALLIGALAIAPLPTVAKQVSATLVSGHDPVFRWVRVMGDAFVPSVYVALEGTVHSATYTGQYDGAFTDLMADLQRTDANTQKSFKANGVLFIGVPDITRAGFGAQCATSEVRVAWAEVLGAKGSPGSAGLANYMVTPLRDWDKE